ncbi:MAG: hypothetical protein AB7Q42_03755 [Acidimicrobiia bacterium]
MTPAEIAGFLARCPQMVVGAIDGAGWPTGTLAASTSPVSTSAASTSESVLSLRFDPRDPILDELARDPHLCCIADEHESYAEIRGVIVHGRVASADQRRADGSQGDVVAVDVVVAVDRTISFDFGRLTA